MFFCSRRRRSARSVADASCASRGRRAGTRRWISRWASATTRIPRSPRGFKRARRSLLRDDSRCDVAAREIVEQLEVFVVHGDETLLGLPPAVEIERTTDHRGWPDLEVLPGEGRTEGPETPSNVISV